MKKKERDKKMKIAVLNEFSQAPKNGIIVKELKAVVEPMGQDRKSVV